jgi:exopolysaccharide biosynthesis polyprenyl glycosylphosphotransferase
VADLVSALQLGADLAAVVLAYSAARLAWPWASRLPGLDSLQESIPESNYRINALVTGLFLVPVFRYLGLYRESHSLLNIQEYRNILRGWLLTMFFTVLAVTSIEHSFQSRGIFLTVWLILLSCLLFFRFAIYRMGLRLRAWGWMDRRVLIYGAGETGRGLLRRLRGSLKTGLEVAGFVDDDPDLRGRTVEGLEVLGEGVELGRILSETGASEVIVALPRANRTASLRIIELCRRNRVSFRLVPSLYDMVVQQVEVLEIGGIPLVGIHAPKLSPIRAVLKRVLDAATSAILLVVLSPILLATAALVAALDGRPVMFNQERIGQGGRPFRMWKFRSMRADSPSYAPAPMLSTDTRVTLLGRILRRTSLDELPQLWNVLLGEMSIVGPRPEMAFIVERYDDLQRQRLSVKPGMTGLWQVSPDRHLPIHDHIDYDIYYIRHQSLLLDAAIVLKTLSSVVRGTGA